MKTFLLTLLTATVGLLSLQAQTTEFAPVGTKWWYSYDTYNPNPFADAETSVATVESIGDTVVADKTLKVLKCVRGIVASPPYLTFRYVYQDSSKVYEAKIVNADSVTLFQCLYDFDAIMGSSYEMGYLDIVCQIESSDSIEINGFWLNRQNIIPSGPFVGLVGGATEGIVIEQIGSVRYLFPYLKGDPDIRGLRCFEHPIIGHYETGIEATCDTIYTALPNVPNRPALTVSFDAQTAQLNLQVPEAIWVGGFTLYDLQGRVAAAQSLAPHQAGYQIDLSLLSMGIYAYVFTDRSGAAVQRGKVVVVR